MYGNISASTKEDDYFFTIPVSTYIFVSIGETGAHDSHFLPEIYVYKPSGGYYGAAAGYYYTWLKENGSTYSGTWSIKVTRGDGYMTGGNYERPGLHVTAGRPPVSIFGGGPRRRHDVPLGELCRLDLSRRHRFL